MLSKQARQIKAYLSSNEGRGILRTARMVLKANNIRVSDDDSRGLKSLAMAYALYPNQLKQATGGLVSRTADFKGVDFCSADPSLCTGRKQIPRIQMPVLEGNNLMLVTKNLKNGLIDWKNPPKNALYARWVPIMQGRNKGKVIALSGLDPSELEEYGIDETTVGYKYHHHSANGEMKVGVKQVNAPATELKPTQSEINFDKAFGMAVAYLTGAFKNLTKYDPKTVSLISKEGYIVDGHHRWAAIGLLNTYSPEKLIGYKKDTEYRDEKGNLTILNWNIEDSMYKLFLLDQKDLLPEFLADEKGGGDKSLTLACMAFNLPMKDLLPCLNACTDSLGVARKPFDEKDPKQVEKITLPGFQGYELLKHQDQFSGDEDATSGLKNLLDQTKEVDDSEFAGVNQNYTRVARLKRRMNFR